MRFSKPSFAPFAKSSRKANILTVFRHARRNPRDFFSRLWCPRTIAKSLVFLSGLVVIGTAIAEIFLYVRTGKNSRIGTTVINPFIPLARPSVQVHQGIYRGGTAKTGHVFVERFLGIPYAQTTGGYNRFRPPVKMTAGMGKHDARNWGHKCWGGPDGPDQRSGDDCLNINVWRTRGVKENQNVPVVVYFHSGSFNFGSGAERDIASFVAWSVDPIIGISVNYRVGALGFLSSNLTAEEGILNLGLQDQAAALEWVHENIKMFGGNKDRVTIWGSSAGAHSVGHHIMKIDVPARFQGAIMESGAPTARAVYPYNHPLHEEQYKKFLELTGTIDIPDESKMTHLRSIDIETIVAASESVFQQYAPSLRWPFQPVIDGPGGMIPCAPLESWKARAYHKVPILTGFNTNEGSMFIDTSIDDPKEFDKFFETLIPNFTEKDFRELNELYPDPSKSPGPESKYTEDRPGLGRQYKRLARAYGDFAYIAPVRHTAHFASALDRPDDAAVWMYQFDVNQTVTRGANHGDQGEYVVYSPSVRSLPWSRHGAIGEQMHGYWTSFVISGDVNAVKKGRVKNRSTWAQYGKRGSSAKMVFGEHNNQRAGGKNEGALTENRPDLWGDSEGDFWWARTMLTERI
ncbi:hypothetical protein V496_05322 [Pseudogymnoascus sp. VKM F-4515 (FW-2607)]|nr:hypothetical protein V496_05322 [Pseudogymnoascus sp. VKM F-4515 (FW-2607)]KFY94811.1 hypothetical protein V498_03708 [Pseudogymnoascus sp. VKM F-4517 (FW-2822)]